MIANYKDKIFFLINSVPSSPYKNLKVYNNERNES